MTDPTVIFGHPPQQFWAQNAGKPWSRWFPPVARFEVRQGDVWANDPSTKNRSEFCDQALIQVGKAVKVTYMMLIESGAPTDVDWTVLGQFHHDLPDGASPPFGIYLDVNDVMYVQMGHSDANGLPAYMQPYRDTGPIARGRWYIMEIDATFGPAGSLIVKRDGHALVNYTGQLGFNEMTSAYWKMGIYRAASAVTMAVNYAWLEIS